MTSLVASAATGIRHGTDGRTWVAGSAPSRISFYTEPTQMPSRAAARSALIVASSFTDGQNGGTPSDLVAWTKKRAQSGHFASPLREADVLWAPEFKHAVQCVDGNHDSVARRRSVRDRRPSPMIRLKRLMSASTRARQL
jgi:hypothetical protein